MELSHLAMRILFKCAQGVLQKKYISQFYSEYSALERKDALASLLSKELIVLIRLPKPNVRKTPTLYKITDKGIRWLEEYEKNYPVAG